MNRAEIPVPSSDLPTRFAMGVVMAAIACVAIFLDGWVFRGLVVAAAAVMMIEWSDMHRVSRLWGYVGAALLAGTLLVLPERFFPAADSNPAVLDLAELGRAWLCFGASAGLAVLLALVSRRFTMFVGFLYIAIPSLALAILNWAWLELVFWAVVVTSATDICAYFAGRAIGGPKLAPRLSPNKTWAGLAGGMAGAALFGWLVASWFALGSPFLYIGAAMGLIAQAGDLYESWLKRRAGVKDSGTILPGHGGALDRLDGLLPVSLATFLILATGLWTA